MVQSRRSDPLGSLDSETSLSLCASAERCFLIASPRRSAIIAEPSIPVPRGRSRDQPCPVSARQPAPLPALRRGTGPGPQARPVVRFQHTPGDARAAPHAPNCPEPGPPRTRTPPAPPPPPPPHPPPLRPPPPPPPPHHP